MFRWEIRRKEASQVGIEPGRIVEYSIPQVILLVGASSDCLYTALEEPISKMLSSTITGQPLATSHFFGERRISLEWNRTTLFLPFAGRFPIEATREQEEENGVFTHRRRTLGVVAFPFPPWSEELLPATPFMGTLRVNGLILLTGIEPSSLHRAAITYASDALPVSYKQYLMKRTPHQCSLC